MPYCREKHMKECKKRKIKGFHKKSVWPSIVLFLIFIAFCLQLAISFVKVFEVYLMDSKMADIKDSTEHLGGLIAARMEGEDLLDAVSYVRGYLKKENDISVIDRDFQVLLHFGETVPDFGNGTIIKFFDVYKLVPDAGMEIPDWENMLLRQRTLRDIVMNKREKNIRQWFNMWLQKKGMGILNIFSANVLYIESWGPQYNGAEKVKHWFDEWNTRGTVLQWDIKQYFHKGDQTIVEWYFKNTMNDGKTEAFDGMSLIKWTADDKICFLQEFGCNEHHYDPYRDGPTPHFEDGQSMWF